MARHEEVVGIGLELRGSHETNPFAESDPSFTAAIDQNIEHPAVSKTATYVLRGTGQSIRMEVRVSGQGEVINVVLGHNVDIIKEGNDPKWRELRLEYDLLALEELAMIVGDLRHEIDLIRQESLKKEG